jgi:ATP-dependent helicase/nuclease subunit B
VPLEIRVDRVDRLADGTIVVIDYKSGQGTPRRWAGPRPDPVQLPLYAAFRSEPPGAVALALLPLAKSGFVGLAARDGVLPEVRALAATRRAELRALDWPALLAGWREALTALALGYAAGAAAVDPAAGACEHCPLGALCRIAAPDLGPDEAAGEDDD